MQEHPIPRQITTFEFKLIGELTLRQFGYLAFGAVGGVILFFSVPSFAFLNYVAAAVPVGIGLGFAFMPINERPMDVWVKNLYKRLTSATQFYYKKNNHPPKILLGLTLPPREVMVQHIQAQQKLNEYLQARPKPEGANTAAAVSESIDVKTKSIQSLMQGNAHGIRTSFAGAPSVSPSAPPALPTHNDVSVIAPKLESSENQDSVVAPAPVVQNTITAPTPAFAQAFNSPVSEIAGPTPTPSLIPSAPPVAVVEQVAIAPIAQAPATRFSFQGCVLSPNGVPLPGILVYVKKGGEAVRLFRTNEKGEFVNNIPLPADTYILELEDPQKKYAFDRMNVNGATTSYEIFAQKL